MCVYIHDAYRIYVYVYIYVYICMCVCVYMCVFICICVCVYIHDAYCVMYIHTHIYIYTHTYIYMTRIVFLAGAGIAVKNSSSGHSRRGRRVRGPSRWSEYNIFISKMECFPLCGEYVGSFPVGLVFVTARKTQQEFDVLDI